MWSLRTSGSVRARLLRLALLLTLPGLAVSAMLTREVFVTGRIGAETALREAAQGLGQLVDREFVQAEVLLRTLAATDELDHADLPAFDRLARATVIAGGSIVLTDAAGRNVIDTALPQRTDLLAPPPNSAGAPAAHHLVASSEVFITPLRPQGQSGMSIAVVLPIAAGPTHSYDLKLVLPAAVLQAILSRQSLPLGWVSAIIDSAGAVVARSTRPDLHVGHPIGRDLREALIVADEGVRDAVSLDNLKVVVAYSRNPRTGWTVAVNAPRALIAQAGLQSASLLVWLAVVAIPFGILGALQVARGITRRIEAMAQAARSVGEREIWTPIPSGLTEADAVADAMRTAAQALIERRSALSELNDTLAARVAERTHELADANAALEDQRRQLGDILDHLPIGVVVHRADASLVFANREARRLLKLPIDPALEILSWPVFRQGGGVVAAADFPSARAREGIMTERALFQMDSAQRQGPGNTDPGIRTDIEVNASPLRDQDGRIALAVTTLQDVTARLEADEIRRRSQRLEAVGQLTGGVAHEFNNLLMAISGCLDLLGPHLASPRGAALVANAARATERGGRLTRQLLAFARRQHLQAEPVDLNALVAGMKELLESTLGRSIAISTALHPDAWPAMADASQLELVLLNLAINARDAMPGGGTLMIRTANAHTGTPLRAEDPPEGDFTVLHVSDTGEGMPAHVLARVFEPFFTTKDIGLGSGLGLPQVLGVAQQLGGGVSITSQPDAGTTVRVFLPRARSAPAEPSSPVPHHFAAGALLHARILVVDDDAEVREIARVMLEEMGAVATEADSAAAALLMLRAVSSNATPADLVLADLSMPHMTGLELAQEIAAFLPDLPVVLMTGYGAASLDTAGPNVRATLQKPFRAEHLAQVLARQLGRAVAGDK